MSIGVGIIGSGLRGGLVLGARIIEQQRETGLKLRAICDRSPARMREVSLFLHAAGLKNLRLGRIRRCTDYRELVDDPAVDLIVITTPTWFHREPAEYALRSGKKVFLDKPIAVNLEDSRTILRVEKETENPLLMGFTRRYEAPWIRAAELVQSGRIGQLMMIQLRSVIPYTRYYHTWHRRNTWSGGVLNDKSSHHFDVLNWFADSPWRSIHGIGGQSPAFAPREDPPAGCFVCEEDCPYHILKDPDFEEMGIKNVPPSWKSGTREQDRVDTCVFAPGADLTDHCFVTVDYANQVKASLFLCIWGPKAPDQETLELIGTEGKITLTRQTGQLEVWDSFMKQKEEIDCRTADFDSSHFGADRELVRQLRAFVDGEEPVVGAAAGHESLRMVAAAQRSIDAGGTPVESSEI